MRYTDKITASSLLFGSVFGATAYAVEGNSLTVYFATLVGLTFGAYGYSFVSNWTEEVDEFVDMAEKLEERLPDKSFEELDTVASKILVLTSEKPGIQEDYSVLVGEYWLKQMQEKNMPTDLEVLQETDQLKYLKSPSSINRAKRKIENSEVINFPDKEVDISDIVFTSESTKEFREKREKTLRKKLGRKTKTRLERLVEALT